MNESNVVYLAFGSYGLTIFRNLTAENQTREGMARMLKISPERMASLEMLVLKGGDDGTTSAAIFRPVGKVSYTDLAETPSLDRILSSALNVKLKGGAEIRLDAGITAVLAQTQWGKTTFTSRDLVPSLAELPDISKIDYISFLEPIEDLRFEHIDVSAVTAQNHTDFFRLLGNFILSDKKVCVVDSLRAFIYDSSVGGTAAGGMDAYLPVQLTALSNVAAMLGKHIVVTINPMMPAASEDDRAKFNDLQKRIESSVPTVMTSIGQRMLNITMRGPSSKASKQIQYQVPEFDFNATPVSGNLIIPSAQSVVARAETVGNVIAGVIGNL